MAAREFGRTVSMLLASKQFTLGHYKAHLRSNLNAQAWRMSLPGIRTSPGVVQAKDELKVLDAMTDEELEDAHLVKGLRLRRVSKQTGKDEAYVEGVIQRYGHMDVMHKFLHLRKYEGLPLPTTPEEAQQLMAMDKRYREYMASKQLKERMMHRVKMRQRRGRGR